MESSQGVCARCKKVLPNNVMYQCVRCFTKYCVECDDSQSGKNCPKCGMSARIVLDQGNSKKDAA